jgi:hypothetical protein
MTIETIHFNEQGDFEFKVSFMYSGHNLETVAMPRTTAKADIVKEIMRVVNEWEAQRADTNYQSLKTQYEGKTVTL